MRVVVAMSGGVDSSVTAGLLVEQGHEVIGIHMKLHDTDAPAGQSKTCCGLDDALDARRVADHLGIPFYVVNLREAFNKAVMQPFVDDYVNGRTPNPCVACNGVLKFRVLLARALQLGASHLATGHYCQIDPEGPWLRQAVDPAKDQSYFLFPMSEKAMKHTLFPLGGMTKPEVRAHADRLNLPVAVKPESMDVCFLPDGNHGGFVQKHRPDLDTSGEIVDEVGRVLGYHEGYHKFTVGQRKGLGVALGAPAYVVRVEPETRRVVVGTNDALMHHGLVASNWTWFETPDPAHIVHARIRHRGGLIPSTVQPLDGDRFQLHFLEAARAVCPGQAVVLYEGDRVLGGGWIERATAEA